MRKKKQSFLLQLDKPLIPYDKPFYLCQGPFFPLYQSIVTGHHSIPPHDFTGVKANNDSLQCFHSLLYFH